MKVKELIKALKKMPQEEDVVINTGSEEVGYGTLYGYVLVSRVYLDRTVVVVE